MVDKETIHPKTVWTFIKEDIELQIIRGVLRSADKVPSISEIAESYDVSKTTAQKALEDMFSEGTITKRKGVGYFVIPYTKERLRAKHKLVLINMFNDCLLYAEKLDLTKDDAEEIKSLIAQRLDTISSR